VFSEISVVLFSKNGALGLVESSREHRKVVQRSPFTRGEVFAGMKQ
jgi:hypothetical protein